MLKLFPCQASLCEPVSRRSFLVEVGSLAGLGLSLDFLLKQRAAQASEGAGPGRDVNCILIWGRGGTSHHDTFDPKPLARDEVRGEFGVIDTALPGIQFSDQMPNCAKHLGRYSLMRNLNPQNGTHGMADAIMMSGHRFNPSVTYPSFGSVVAKERTPRGALPPFVQLGSQLDEQFGGGSAGYLGLAYNPFQLPDDPNSDKFTVRDVSLSKGMNLERLNRRHQALELIDTMQRNANARIQTLEAMDDYYQRAFGMITSPETQKAFDLSAEDDRTRDAYGRSSFGQSCLLARRLIEAGTRFVTVTSGNWDNHTDIFNSLKTLCPPFDQAFPALLQDLEDRGMLDNTLVVFMSDFGRTPVINSATGRDHWASASFMLMAGAKTPGGNVIGQTDDIGSRPVGPEYYADDVAATIYTKLGIPLDTTHVTPDGRPMRLCDGRIVSELMG